MKINKGKNNSYIGACAITDFNMIMYHFSLGEMMIGDIDFPKVLWKEEEPENCDCGCKDITPLIE